MKITAVASSLLVLATNAFGADETILHPTTVGILIGHEKLTANLPDWRERTLQLQHQFGKRHLIGAELSETDRFGLRDSRLGISYTHPLSDRLTGTVDAGFSP
ncbi:MAG: YaiO family outer membrane beta-barrel protein, partial [Pseudomonadota bacterium]|nr:YaiO family outer membrane beta-barrel protein [Pseudomonadota bacterium]